MSLLCQWLACSEVATCRRRIVFRSTGRFMIADLCDRHRRYVEARSDRIILPDDREAA